MVGNSCLPEVGYVEDDPLVYMDILHREVEPEPAITGRTYDTVSLVHVEPDSAVTTVTIYIANIEVESYTTIVLLRCYY
jgi:hypothetical protein